MFLCKKSEYFKQGVLHWCWDFENGKKTLAILEISKESIAFWGKFMA